MRRSGKKGQHPDLLVVGWREWVALPDLGIPAIKAKLDTGARTSSLHTFSLETYRDRGALMVRFGIHPLQKNRRLEIFHTAEVVDRRRVSDSGGHHEMRYVIGTTLAIAGRQWFIEVNLANRDTMLFRFLLGRTAMHRVLAVNPARSYITGKSLPMAYAAWKGPQS